ncbi:hypothetical protein [Rhodococcus sp. 1163]|uniref:hypothetical protein n=1 Tax=Rhodococcus sp. 1163 TaxID=1905289 RepID=UPI00277B5406|nr:hypothetical protein [Rhodococcus sp. 1163]
MLDVVAEILVKFVRASRFQVDRVLDAVDRVFDRFAGFVVDDRPSMPSTIWVVSRSATAYGSTR